jgi:hypothetical protein
MIARIIEAGYEFSEIIKIAGFILLMNDIEEAFNNAFFSEMLKNAGIKYSGNKHTLALGVVENELITPNALLEKVPIATLRSLYYSRYDRVSTQPKPTIISEILISYGLEERKAEKTGDKEKGTTSKQPSKGVINFAFVLMPFTKELTEIYNDIIKPTIERQNLKCLRADDFFTPNKIMDDIEKAIKESSFIIADLTGKNPNVFYEVGMSHILKKKVILLAQSNDDVPFDLRQWRNIRYDSSEKGLNKLSKKLEKTIKGILKEL